MYRWRHHSRALLIARRLSGGFPEERGAGQKDGIYVQRVALEGLLFVGHVSIRGMGHVRRFFILSSSFFIKKRYSGDYGTKVPPLPIPNREVKLRHADGTAQVGE